MLACRCHRSSTRLAWATNKRGRHHGYPRQAPFSTAGLAAFGYPRQALRLTAGGGLVREMRGLRLLFPRSATPVAENAFALNILRVANNFMEMFHARFEWRISDD
jgi:hypothetical protein